MRIPLLILTVTLSSFYGLAQVSYTRADTTFQDLTGLYFISIPPISDDVRDLRVAVIPLNAIGKKTSIGMITRSNSQKNLSQSLKTNCWSVFRAGTLPIQKPLLKRRKLIVKNPAMVTEQWANCMKSIISVSPDLKSSLLLSLQLSGETVNMAMKEIRLKFVKKKS